MSYNSVIKISMQEYYTSILKTQDLTETQSSDLKKFLKKMEVGFQFELVS